MTEGVNVASVRVPRRVGQRADPLQDRGRRHHRPEHIGLHLDARPEIPRVGPASQGRRQQVVKKAGNGRGERNPVKVSSNPAYWATTKPLFFRGLLGIHEVKTACGK